MEIIHNAVCNVGARYLKMSIGWRQEGVTRLTLDGVHNSCNRTPPTPRYAQIQDQS